ncbi:Acyl dehydratase [Dietzia kunjamensis subsp. schimae]|uniref:Acyl dehydratase n=1 Tax=Dietzia kunjamensis subsp. schimae TaxID=498198 RepID=A0ABY1N103_9ACTN|nr:MULTISPECIES: MaoC family dehydratase [Dietzia]MBB1014795.1 MaoC family dehydratase [Dietzia kunjamensis subsp. schimae]SMO70308.1 Acyl dehydratase [Dietzia kunjamensis subsp. schimae]
MTQTTQRRPTSVQDLQDLVGVELGPTEWHVVDQSRIDGFADLTGDHQWIHVDPARAADSPFGSTIAHGLYSLSRTPAFLEELMAFDGFAHSLNYGYDKVRFIHPLPVDSRIRLRASLTSVEETSPGAVKVITMLTVEAEGIDKPILIAESIGRFTV